MARIKFKVMALAALLLALSATAFAQLETGQITGRVTDPNGAVVPGAAVAVKSVETGAERAATSDAEGSYTVTNLQPGLYDVTVQAQSFAKSTQRVQVTVGAKASLDTQLSVTAIAGETVDVIAGSGVEVNTQNQELSTVVSGEQIRELPTITRNPYNLVQLSGNAQTDDPSTSQNDTAGTSTYRGAGASLNGQRAASTNILLDGADNNNNYTATVGQLIPLDSVQEFRVVTSNFSAEYGRASGGIVNVATRAGQQRLPRHGLRLQPHLAPGLERLRQQRQGFGARRLRAQPVRLLARRPRRPRQALLLQLDRVDSRAQPGAGDGLRADAAAHRGCRPPARARFFANYQLAATPTGRVSTAGELGIAGVPGLDARLHGGGLQPPDRPRRRLPAERPPDRHARRLELEPTHAGLRPLRACRTRRSSRARTANSPYQGFNTGSFAFNQNALLSLTHTFSQNVVSQSKFAFNRVNTGSPLGENPAGPTLYLATARQAINSVLVALPGYLPFNPGSAIPAAGPTNQFQFYQDLNYQAGSHQFRFGGSYFHIQQNRTFGAFQNSVQTLGTGVASGANNLIAGQLHQVPGGR